MTDVDIIGFQGAGDGLIFDLLAEGFFTPSPFGRNEIIEPTSSFTDGKYSFVVSRKFSNGDES